MQCKQGLAQGVKGNFKFTVPFDRHNSNKVLEVTSVRDIGEILDSGEDLYEFIYKPAGLSREEMKRDLKNGVKIVVFKDSGGLYLYVPSSKIALSPDISGYLYTEKVIGIDLGPLPDDLDLEQLKIDISQLVEGRIGIKPAIQVVKASDSRYITEADNTQFNAARTLRMNNDKNYYIQLLRCQGLVSQLERDKSDMDCIIKKKVPM